MNGRSFWYQMGRDPDHRWSNVGSLLKSCAVERSIRIGHSTIDLGNGAHGDKREWSDDEDPVPRVVWSHGPFPGLVTKIAARVAGRSERHRSKGQRSGGQHSEGQVDRRVEVSDPRG